ncbi:MAG: thiamine phosphate synthase [Halarcobacter sp.]
MIRYLITDPKYYSNDKNIFEQKLKKALTKNIDMACFRDKSSSNFEELAEVFIKVCKEKNIQQYLINSNITLAKKLNATGVHLNSKQFDKIKEAKNLELFTIISCHNEDEIKKALDNNIDAITYSPIFFTPNKGKAKGIENLEYIISKYKELKIIALGGIIDENHIKQIKASKACGFASIRYFI